MSQIQQIKERTSIEEVIGERINLVRSGGYFRGLCPFHSEKSPSFFVSSQMQRFKCFGCGAAGDVYEFLQKYDGLTFYEALQLLADRSGVVLEKTSASPADQQRERLREILNLAKEYYHFLLVKHEAGDPARKYLKERGVTSESIRIFQLGYSLPSWEGLINYLNGKKKYSLEELTEVGLIVKNNRGRLYDRFRDRLMFPLNDARGNVVGFSGRVMDPTIKTAKYINSPETDFYHKSQLLYGYSELFQEIRKKKEVIVVEGEFDVITSAQAHVNNIVAIKGSALTPDHARVMKRVVEKVILALDADSAGIEATKRAIPICTDAGLELRIIKVPQGKDPDELARKNAELWRKTASQSLSVYAYLLEVALQQHDISTPEGQRKVIDDLAPIFSQITHAVEREFYSKKLAETLGVRVSVIQSDLEKFGKKSTLIGKSKINHNDIKSNSIMKLSLRQKIERSLWHIWLVSEEEKQAQLWNKLQELSLQTNELSILKKSILEQISKHGQKWFDNLPSDQQQLVFDIKYDPQLSEIMLSNSLDQQWQDLWQQVHKLILQEKLSQITTELDELDNTDTKTPQQEKRQQLLLEEIVLLRKQQ